MFTLLTCSLRAPYLQACIRYLGIDVCGIFERISFINLAELLCSVV